MTRDDIFKIRDIIEARLPDCYPPITIVLEEDLPSMVNIIVLEQMGGDYDVKTYDTIYKELDGVADDVLKRTVGIAEWDVGSSDGRYIVHFNYDALKDESPPVVAFYILHEIYHGYQGEYMPELVARVSDHTWLEYLEDEADRFASKWIDKMLDEGLLPIDGSLEDFGSN
ncbi:hypothetical protein DRJ17_04780 [Candidatus Woesearchaeota archaeon]|nr:MAG: hypothetical protein DRJ17_04780 [Candidatus Woesearchaeota archaeon]